MPPAPQSFKNHARYVPLFHGVTALLIVVNLVAAIGAVRRAPGGDTLVQLGTALGLVLLFWYTRAFPLSVQDRVIRLELRLRTQALAPDLLPRFDALTPGQVVALRFAGDRELPELMRKTLDGAFASPTDIKKAITDWQADHWRA